MNLNRKMLLVGASLIGLAGMPVAAYAAPDAVGPDAGASAQATPTPTAADDGNQFGDVVVIARRREEASQDVPISLTAVSGTQLEQHSVHSVEDLRTLAPGVNIGGQRRDEAQFFIRGQGPGVITTGQRNFTSVATYFAEVPATLAGAGQLFDLESVQVLKGPQGTLFGRNTTGGAVLFQPTRPSSESGGYVKATYGNYNYEELEGAVNVANSADTFAVRLAGIISRRDGYTRSSVTNQRLDERDVEGMRLSVLMKPFAGFESLTIVDYRAKDGAGGSEVLRAVNPNVQLGAVPQSSATVAALTGVPVGTVFPLRVGGQVSVACLSAALPGCPTGPFGNAIAAYAAAYNGGNFASASNSGFALVAPTSTLDATLAAQQALGVRVNQAPLLLRSKALDYGFTNKSTFDINDNLSIKNIIAYRVTRRNEAADYDGTALNFLDNRYVTDQEWSTGSQQFTEEFQVQGKISPAKLQYILGYYHEFTKPGFVQEVPGYTLGSFSERLFTNRDISDAVFAHLEWNPSDFVGLSGGIRQTWDKRMASLGIVNAAGVCTQVNPQTGLVQCPIAYNTDFKGLTYDATLSLHPMNGVLVYGSYRRGYKSGGINLPAPAGSEFFKPEHVDSFEVGAKADWNVGVPLRTNIALFYDKYSDIQIQQSIVFNGIATSIVPPGIKAINKGVEFETTIIPVRGLTLSGFASYLDAHPTVGIPGVVVAGRQLSNQPKWKYGVSGAFRLPIPDSAGKLTVLGDWSWQSSTHTTPVPGLVDSNPSYGLLNARLEWNNAAGSGLDFAIFGTNLTNKVYVLGGYPIAQLGFDSAVYGEPRMYGASLKVHFGAH
ncbi:MAG: TonB-dependent receptor [Bradyrhizobium sp.]|nr:TonB-dependent receptor [Bradyrhizobium sp.]